MPLLETPLWLIGLAGLVGYLLGSIPAGVVLARVFGLGDLRRIGSGNIGATNVLRTGNKLAAALTLVLDAGKGALAVGLAWLWLGPDAAQAAGLAAFLGHLFPVFIGFRGGKGVATFLGVMLALAPLVGIAACATWAAVAGYFRISSLAALAAAVLTPLWAWVWGAPSLLGLAVAMAGLMLWTHRANIGRLLSGTEPRIGDRT
ncbi:MAG: glycerol-3-phosphate 1-O-acyltransferase PlsY [Alkalilacustris sp.]